MVEPPDGAMPPFEALDRFDPGALKTVDPAFPYLPGWWVKKAPNSHITNPFFERLYREELVCWARHQSPAAPWSCIPGTAWRHLRIWNWSEGALRRLDEDGQLAEEWFEARIASASTRVKAAARGGKQSGLTRAVPPERIEAVVRTFQQKSAQSPGQSRARIITFVAKKHDISESTVKRYLGHEKPGS
jgi:hypothetical protein